jgi:hypothetical protein
MGRPKKSEQTTEGVGISGDEQAPFVTSVATTSAKYRRNSDGLLLNQEYPKDEETGLINWRKLVKKEYLVPNAAKFPEGTALRDLKVEDLDDNQLLILLGGIKDLAQIRGIRKVAYTVHVATPTYVAVTCNITWLPNYETDFAAVEFEALADAHTENTKSFARDFLMATAENRAFTRAVRNFLRINIVGSDEMGDKKNASTSEESAPKSVSALDPVNVLTKLMDKASISFDTVKRAVVKEGNAEAEAWTSVTDIPKDQIFKLIERIKKKVEENAAS